MTGRIFETASRKRLVDEVISQIQQKISLGFFKPGDRLPSEPELMAAFGVGRSTIREAVKVLANIGLLEVKQGDGTFVLERSACDESLEQRLRRADILEVYEVRKILEVQIAGLAARHRTAEDLAEMAFHLDKQKEYTALHDKEGYVNSDLAFHMAVAAATHNATLADLYSIFARDTRRAVVNEINDPEITYQVDFHDRLYAAISEQNSAEAQKWTAEYLDNIVNIVRRLVR